LGVRSKALQAPPVFPGHRGALWVIVTRMVTLAPDALTPYRCARSHRLAMRARLETKLRAYGNTQALHQ